MTNFTAIFPLNLILYPGEILNLHIFEPKYKQMIKECIDEKKPFGILPVIDGAVKEYGTLAEITDVVEIYNDGKMDIRAKGTQIFRVLELVKSVPEKLYSGAIVNYPENEQIKVNLDLADLITNEVKRLYKLLNEETKLPSDFKDWNSYMFAQKSGLTLSQSYELLSIFNELQRMEYLRRHLNHMKPVLEELELLKARIQMNGHFRDLTAHDL